MTEIFADPCFRNIFDPLEPCHAQKATLEFPLQQGGCCSIERQVDSEQDEVVPDKPFSLWQAEAVTVYPLIDVQLRSMSEPSL